MTEEQLSVHPSREAAGDGAILQRAFGRLVRSPGVIPLEVTRDLPERVTRLARGHLPLLDALQSRWGSSLDASWPDASGLPFVTARAGRPEAEAGLSHLDTAIAIDQRNSPSLPEVMASRSPGQGTSAPLAPLTPVTANFHSDGQSGTTERPLPIVRAQSLRAGQLPLTSTLQRQLAATEGGPAEGSPGQGERSGAEAGLTLSASNPPATTEQPLPIARAQPLSAAQSPVTSTLQRRASITGGLSSGSLVQRSSSEPRNSYAVRTDVALISANHEKTTPVGGAGQARAVGRSSAPGVTQVWGEPIVQRLRGGRKAAGTENASASTSRSSQPDRAEGVVAMPGIAQRRAVAVSTEAISSVRRSDVDAGDSVAVSRAGETSTSLMPLQGISGAVAETVPNAPPVVVKSEPAAGRDAQPVYRASAEIGYPLPLSRPNVSVSVDLKGDATGPSTPGSGVVSEAVAVGGMPDRRPLPVVAPVAHGLVASGTAPLQAARIGNDLVVRRDATRTSVLTGLKDSVTRRAAVDEAGLGRRASAGWEAVDAPVGRVAGLPVVAVPAAGSEMMVRASPEPGLVWSGSQPAMPSNTTFQSLSTPVQRQGNNTTGASSSSSAVPAGAHASPSSVVPGESQAAARAGPAGEGRVRLDDLEMERVANEVMERLRQRLLMEREARGL